VRVDLPDVLHTDPRTRSHRALIASLLLAVIVVAAAGITGTAHFAGPRWVPHWNLARHAPAPRKLPSPALPTQTLVPPGTGSFPLGTVLLWIIVAITAVGVALLLWRWWAGRPSRAATSRHSLAVEATSEVPVEPEPDAPALSAGIELALQALDAHREPADAIVRAWLGLQETAEESGIKRLAAETPTEFTSRILGRAFADARPVQTLLRLYLRTRFGDHPVTGADVAAVRVALQELVRTWHAPESPAAASSR
jgi:hypothetical protein